MKNIRVYHPRTRKRRKNKKSAFVSIIILLLVIFIGGLANKPNIAKDIDGSNGKVDVKSFTSNSTSLNIENLPEYDGKPSCVINDNIPKFTNEDYEEAKEMYIFMSELDNYGRCGVCKASLGEDTLCNEDRPSIASVHPSGWRQAFYGDLIDNGGALYNRCHLLMYAMSGLTSDRRNLITGTRYLNNNGMLPYETAVHNWIERYPSERVLYRVTPIFVDNELVARGVHIEAGSVSDSGKSLHINVYCYNIQPGIYIDYRDGSSQKSDV